jgi:hypothetical protein
MQAQSYTINEMPSASIGYYIVGIYIVGTAQDCIDCEKCLFMRPENSKWQRFSPIRHLEQFDTDKRRQNKWVVKSKQT